MVEINDICFSYGKKSPAVLDHISFTVPDGMCTAILGNNGAGKSTLLKCIDCILRPSDGSVVVNGRNVFDMSRAEMARNIAYVAQSAVPVDMTVFDAVLLGRRPYIRWDAQEHDYEVVRSVLRELGLDRYELRSVSELSGGEIQKVMLARALAQEPQVLLLDEPTSSLDPSNQHNVMQLIRRIAHEKNICVICVIHDLNLAIRYCDRFLFIKNSSIYSYGDIDTMTPAAIEDVYSMHVHTVEYMGIPVIVPFPDVKAHRSIKHEHKHI